MSVILPISSYIEIGYISLYLSQNDAAKQIALKGVAFDPNQSSLLAVVTPSVEWAYQQNPNDPTLNATGLYLLALCGQYVNEAIRIANNQSVAKPVLTGPTNQTVNVGATATFSVSVTGTGPFTYAWYLNGVLIPGATSASYQKANAQLADSGGLYSVAVTNAGGTMTSNQASLTVTASILLYAYYSDVDPTADINAQIDNFNYQFTVVVTHNQPISIPIPQAASNNKWWVWRVVATEQDNNTWYNTPLNSGSLPDGVFYAPAHFNSKTYYYLRNASSFDFTAPLILSKV